jgi:uncharacterized protein YgiM (DUF1202 family)
MRRFHIVRRTFCLVLIVGMLVTAAMPAFAASKRGSGSYVVTTVDKGDRLNVHASASIDGEIIGHLKKNTVVVYKSIKNGWWKVSYYGGSGYVDRRFLTSVASLPSAKYKAVKDVPVFAKASKNSRYLTMLKTSMKVSITGMSGNWVRIQRGSYVGWTMAKYLRRVS